MFEIITLLKTMTTMPGLFTFKMSCPHPLNPNTTNSPSPELADSVGVQQKPGGHCGNQAAMGGSVGKGDVCPLSCGKVQGR